MRNASQTTVSATRGRILWNTVIINKYAYTEILLVGISLGCKNKYGFGPGSLHKLPILLPIDRGPFKSVKASNRYYNER